MPIPLRVLIVEDSDDDSRLVLRQLRNGGYDPQHRRIETRTGMLSALDEQTWDVIICDYSLPHFDALAALQIVQQSGKDIPFIIVSGQSGEETAVAAMKAGADDYLMKDRLARLPAAVQKEIREVKGRLEHRSTTQQLQATFLKMDLTVRAAGAGTWEWDLVTGSVAASPKMFELLGLDPTTSVASFEAWRSVLHADDMARPELDAKRALAEHTLLSEDYRVILPDGEIRWVNLVGEGLYDDQGQAVVMVGLCWDVTARKRLEQGIRERAKEHEAFVHLSEIAAAPNLGVDQLYQEMATVLPSSWQYPELACARIVVEDREFCSNNFVETPWRQTSPIVVDGREVGRIEVGYVNQTPAADHGPFLREEGQLIQAIAERIGHLTASRRAEAALKTSEAKYRAVVENAFEGVIVFSEGNKKFCNRRCLEIIGYSAEEFARLDFMAAVHPEDRGPIHRELEALTLTGVASAGFQCRVITKHGDTKWIEAKGAPIEWEGESSVIVFADDITERREIQHRLKESEERYRRLFEATPDGIALIGPDGRIEQANSAQARMFGYDSPAELTGVHATRLVAPSSRDQSAQNMVRRLNGEDLPPVQYELVRRDGSRFFGEILAAVLCDAQGAVSGYTCLTHDISARLHDEAVLRESEARFRAAFMTGPDALFWASLEDGRLCEVNERFEALFGYARDELLGKTSLELGLYVNPSDRAKMVAALKEHGIVRQLELQGKRKNGEIITVALSASQVAQSDQLFLLGVLRDITERKQVEAELSRYRHHLEEILSERTQELVAAKSALADSIARYDHLVEHSRSIILEWDTEGKILFINRWGHEFLGFSPEELIGHSVVGTIVAPVDEDGNDLAKKMENVQAAPDEYYSSENENIKKNGERVWISWTNQRIISAGGTHVKILSVGIDRTPQRRAELELARYRSGLEQRITEATEELAQRNRDLQLTSERLVLATRAANLGVWDWDVTRDQLTWDDAMYGLYGISRQDFAHAYDAWLVAIHPDDKERVDQAVQDALRGEHDYAREFRIVRPDGCVRFIQSLRPSVPRRRRQTAENGRRQHRHDRTQIGR